MGKLRAKESAVRNLHIWAKPDHVHMHVHHICVQDCMTSRAQQVREAEKTRRDQCEVENEQKRLMMLDR